MKKQVDASSYTISRDTTFPRLMRFKETDAYLASSLQWLRHGSRVQRESTWNSPRNPRTKNAAGEIAESVTSHCDHWI